MNKLTILYELLRRIQSEEIMFEDQKEAEQHLLDIRKHIYEELRRGNLENGETRLTEIEKKHQEYLEKRGKDRTVIYLFQKKRIDQYAEIGGYSREWLNKLLDRRHLDRNYGTIWNCTPIEIKDFYLAEGYMKLFQIKEAST